MITFLELDLNQDLHFEKGLIYLTPQGLFSYKKHNLLGADASQNWDHWAFSEKNQLRLHDHAGVASLELVSEEGCLASWRFTLAQNPAATRLVQHYNIEKNRFLGGSHSEQELGTQSVCPSCWVPLPPDQEECPACSSENLTAPSTWTLFRLWRFAKPYKGQLLAGFLLTLASTAATLVPPYLTMPLMDDILLPYQSGQPIDQQLTIFYLAALFLAALLAWALGWAKTYILALVSERIGADLRTETYEHLMKLSLEYFGGKRTGDLMARIGSESDRICLFLSLHLLDFATDVLMILMTAVILVSIDPWLALVTLTPLPFIGWAIHVVRDKLRFGFEKIDRIWSEVTSVLADTIPGVRVVKAFAQEERETDRFRLANQHNLAVNDRVNRVWALFSPTITLLTEIGLLVVWAFGIWQISNDAITVGMLTACLAYIGRFYTRLDSMSRIVAFTQQAATASKRIFDILDHVSSVPDPVQPVKLTKVEGRIDLQNVGFRYGNRAVTKGINLQIAPGEMIGLVGHSGSGKSTLVNLICRFYDAAEGTIKLDGVDIRSIAVADYRRHIGLVLQEPFLFFGTIAENIAYGKPDASREEIIAAARAAHAHEFILRLPHGYDSLVGERGQSLSGGERQRISIARALLIDPQILILDEATSSVDSTTEKEIQKALDNLVKGRTTIAIAHRLSTLRKADRLIVLDKGQVVEQGSHDQLMSLEGVYRRMYDTQARQAMDAVDEELGVQHD
ncbi:ABC transporter ATP-binding protein [Polynucleobacter sp. 30F-ANTBAC]|jgi:ATP-binding cassette, subfamily B, bacterial|uniref:cyanophycin metabolism-associated ABC transporter n=1 Tax=Polynucleobacter sp. 30F-ANTBAC TaxID=2689095 RepID=UPI001C0D9387|nr:ABC transporter ATP-binding protein [Polynucleobacter sp. 30F-ANTBAC]